MYAERISRIQAELQARNISVLAVMPGTNMHYLSGLDFHLMERPTLAFIPATGQPVFVVPTLEKAKFADPPYPLRVFDWSDEDGYEATYREAIDSLPEMHTLAIEYLVLRVLELHIIQASAPNTVIVDAHPIIDTQRVYKTPDEVALMREAIQISEQALADLLENIKPGMTEKAIARMLLDTMSNYGGEDLPFNPIVLAGERSALPHGVPGDRQVQMGEVLLIDFGTRKGGYVSDITRTFVMGQTLEGKKSEVYELVKAANAAGRAAAKPGVTCQDVDRATRQVIVDGGYGEYFIHRTGHGIGMDGHERPNIVEGNDQVLEPGMTFTIEPGIYIPGEIGVRIEDNMVVTETDCESLTTFDRDLKVIPTSY